MEDFVPRQSPHPTTDGVCLLRDDDEKIMMKHVNKMGFMMIMIILHKNKDED